MTFMFEKSESDNTLLFTMVQAIVFFCLITLIVQIKLVVWFWRSCR